MGRAKPSSHSANSSAQLGFEAKLWLAADKLRSNMDAAEYKHVVLGLIFLKYISDAFEAKHAELEAQKAQGANPEDPDEYRAASIFWVSKEARWAHLKASAPQPAPVWVTCIPAGQAGEGDADGSGAGRGALGDVGGGVRVSRCH